MELLYRNATPAYKGSQARPTRKTGLLSGLGSLIGCGARPAYRTVDGASAQAPAPCRSWWQVFAVTPSYKTAAPGVEDLDDPCATAPEEGVVDAGPADRGEDPAMQVVIL